MQGHQWVPARFGLQLVDVRFAPHTAWAASAIDGKKCAQVGASQTTAGSLRTDEQELECRARMDAQERPHPILPVAEERATEPTKDFGVCFRWIVLKSRFRMGLPDSNESLVNR